MKFSSRELILSGITGVALLIGLSYWLGKPKLDAWSEITANRKTLKQRMELSERIIAQRYVWDERLEALRARLSRYPEDKDATADYLRILERVAKANNVNLVRRRSRKETKHGDFYELAIDCTWEADLHSIVSFLFALEQENVTMDVDDLTIALVPAKPGNLRGDFTLICVYTRETNNKIEPTTSPNAP